MYKIAKLTFEAADGAQKDGQLQEQVENYFSALINQGRVAEYFLMQQDGALVAIASLPEEDALSEQYDNKYVKRFSEGLSVHWELIGEEVFDSHVCTCQHSSCYLLDGDGEEDGPVFCGDCGGEVPALQSAGRRDAGACLSHQLAAVLPGNVNPLVRESVRPLYQASDRASRLGAQSGGQETGSRA